MVQYDYLISGGKLVDGSGSPWRYADLAVSDGKISAIGTGLNREGAKRLIDATGMIVCPGFIDPHSHVDITILADQWMEFRIMQGITTEIVGQDGLSYAPASPQHLQEWRRYLVGLNGDFPEKVSWDWSTTSELLERYQGKSSNVVHLIPHGAVRVEVMGWDDREAADKELSKMQALVSKSLEEGAAGISTGLTYIPCSHASTEEMIALCKPVGQAGGVLSIHLRSYAQDFISAIEEAIEIGRQSAAAVQLSHLRMADVSTWGSSSRVLQLIDQARGDGIDVTFDLYPYTVGCAPLFCLIPAWAQSGGPDAILDRLSDERMASKISAEMAGWQIDWTNYTLSNAPTDRLKPMEGWQITKAAKSLKMDVYGFILKTLYETKFNATIVAAGGNEEDNVTMFGHPACMIGSDGVMVGGQPHPRGYGTYPRILAEYVRNRGILRLEEAIHKMSAMPAMRHNIKDRGLLHVGAAADVVVFSLDEITDHAGYENARRLPGGVSTVLINGQAAVMDGIYQGSSFGKGLTPLL